MKTEDPGIPKSTPLRRVAKRVLGHLGDRPRPVLLGAGRGIVLDIDFETQAMYFLGLYEIELQKYLLQLCRPEITAFDIGASVGYECLILARLCHGVVAFEPDPAAVARFQANVALNPRLASKIELRQAPVGGPGSGDLTVDGLVEGGLPAPGVLKVDVEGAEADVLLGAAGTLRDRHPGVLVEVHSPGAESASRSILEGHGYRVVTVDRRRILREKRPMPHNRWLVARL